MTNEQVVIATNMQHLIDSMLNNTAVSVRGSSDVIIGNVVAIEKEDGSGRNFNVTFSHGKKLFVKLHGFGVVQQAHHVIKGYAPIV